MLLAHNGNYPEFWSGLLSVLHISFQGNSPHWEVSDLA